MTQAKRWTAFLVNHREVIAAMDFITHPTDIQALSKQTRHSH